LAMKSSEIAAYQESVDSFVLADASPSPPR